MGCGVLLLALVMMLSLLDDMFFMFVFRFILSWCWLSLAKFGVKDPGLGLSYAADSLTM